MTGTFRSLSDLPDTENALLKEVASRMSGPISMIRNDTYDSRDIDQRSDARFRKDMTASDHVGFEKTQSFISSWITYGELDPLGPEHTLPEVR